LRVLKKFPSDEEDFKLDKFLKDKTALITGSSRGIGRAIALKLASLGSNIILHYRKNVEEAEAIENELKGLGVKVAKYSADLSDLEQVKIFLSKVVQNHPQIDIFVANAAATAFKPLLEIREHHIQKTLNITITTFILAMAAFKPKMSAGSKVITISGIDTKKYCVNHGLLAAAKAALEMLTRYYATELASDKIFVHGVNPGIVDTDSMKLYFGEAYEMAKKEIGKMVPTGTLMPPEAVAEVVAFLCSSAADWMSGETIYADGGLGFMMPVFSSRGSA
jgi:enoyl-[acyl-carrier protein] reductase III